MKPKKLFFSLQLIFSLFVCGFLIIPVVMSAPAGLTVNYFVGLESGLTLRWVIAVWDGYRDTLFLAIGISLACLALTLVPGMHMGTPSPVLLASL